MVNYASIKPGYIEPQDFFGERNGLLAAYTIDNDTINVYPSGLYLDKRIKAVVYEDENDLQGDEVELREGIVSIIWPEELILFQYEEGIVSKIISVYFLPDDWSESEGDVIPDSSKQLVKV